MADDYGVPSFNTGSSNWDNALGSLARGLFPDPSQQARGLAYGAQARENLLKGDQTINERNAAIAALLQARGLDQGSTAMPPAPTWHPSGVPGGAPIMDPPAGLPMTNGQGAPVPPPTVTPTALYNATAGSDGHTGPMLAGTPPPASQPSAVSPPAPNTTTSNGQVPQGDTGSGPLHPGSVTPPGGGQKYAPPAQSNGSPAPVSPGLNLATYVAMQAMAGRDASQAKIQGLAFLTSAFQQGIIDHNTFAQMTSGMGDNAMYESDQATGRTRITEAGATTREGMRLAQQESQFGRTTQQAQITRDAQGNPVVNLPPAPGSTTLRPAGPGFSELLTQQQNEPYQVGGGGPFGAGPRVVTKGTAAGQPGYSAETDRQMNTPVQVVVNGVAKNMSFGEYMQIPLAQRHPLSEKDLNAVRANTVTQAIGSGDTGPARTARTAAIAAEPPKVRTPEEDKAFDTAIDATMQRRFAPGEAMTKMYSLTRDEPALITDETRADIRSRAQDLLDQGVVRDGNQAIDQAITELTRTGHLRTPQQLMDDRGKGVDARNPNIRILQTAKGPRTVFSVPMDKRYQPGALGLAPEGGKENQLVNLGNGRRGVVHNGFYYPYQQ